MFRVTISFFNGDDLIDNHLYGLHDVKRYMDSMIAEHQGKIKSMKIDWPETI